MSTYRINIPDKDTLMVLSENKFKKITFSFAQLTSSALANEVIALIDSDYITITDEVDVSTITDELLYDSLCNLLVKYGMYDLVPNIKNSVKHQGP